MVLVTDDMYCSDFGTPFVIIKGLSDDDARKMKDYMRTDDYMRGLLVERAEGVTVIEFRFGGRFGDFMGVRDKLNEWAEVNL